MMLASPRIRDDLYDPDRPRRRVLSSGIRPMLGRAVPARRAPQHPVPVTPALRADARPTDARPTAPSQNQAMTR